MACSGCLSIRDIQVSIWGISCFTPPSISLRAFSLSNGLPLCQSEPELAIREATMAQLWIRNFSCVPLQSISLQDYRVGHVVPGGSNAIVGGDSV